MCNDTIVLKYLLNMEALQFPRGNYYQIICKKDDVVMRVQEGDPTKFEKSRIEAGKSNREDNNQIFMIEKVKQDDDGYEIVSGPAALVFDEEGKEIRLRWGKQAKDQLFRIVLSPIQAFHKYYWIQTDAKGKQALSLEGILRVEQFDSNKQSQLFRFEQVTNATITNSALIINRNSGKALDVPGASRKKGQTLCQWQLNKRWNQRWRFVKQGNGVVIQSVLNNHALDICEGKKKSGTKIIQYDYNGGENQMWRPEPVGNGVYKFRSCLDSSLFLAIKKQSVDDGGDVEVCSEENPSIYWRVEGAQP